jgi:hypothetical protein
VRLGNWETTERVVSMHANTTALIGAWTMGDVGEGFVGRFHSAIDINAIISERGHEHTADISPPAMSHARVLVKGAEDDDWQSLPGEARHAD